MYRSCVWVSSEFVTGGANRASLVFKLGAECPGSSSRVQHLPSLRSLSIKHVTKVELPLSIAAAAAAVVIKNWGGEIYLFSFELLNRQQSSTVALPYGNDLTDLANINLNWKLQIQAVTPNTTNER